MNIFCAILNMLGVLQSAATRLTLFYDIHRDAPWLAVQDLTKLHNSIHVHASVVCRRADVFLKPIANCGFLRSTSISFGTIIAQDGTGCK